MKPTNDSGNDIKYTVRFNSFTGLPPYISLIPVYYLFLHLTCIFGHNQGHVFIWFMHKKIQVDNLIKLDYLLGNIIL